MKTFHTSVSISTDSLFKLERRGRYEEALAELRHIWENTNCIPNVEGFTPRQAAEIVLRCGALIGFLGQLKQLPNSQEKSKNLLDEAQKRFLDIYDVEKIIECENYVALAYVRTGELAEAQIWIDQALSHDIGYVSDSWLYSNITKSLILQNGGKYEEILETLCPVEDEFLAFGDHFLLGSFCTNLALAYKNLGNNDEALKYLERARSYHQKSEHQIYLGTVENNLAQLYKIENRFDEAHQLVDSAIEVFRKLRDRSREGFTIDTKAQIYCAEGKFHEALKTIEKAISILMRGENAAFTSETYLSKAKILLYLEDSTSAFMALSDGVQIAKSKISEEKAFSLINEFQALMNEKTASVLIKTYSEKDFADAETDEPETIELILPPTIAHYQDFQGVWIKNSHLESFGLQKGTLAVVGKTDLKRGDLVALNETKTDSVFCGFYDSDFGLVCLEGIGEDPRLFDENEIEILGKIIGYGKMDKKQKGKIEVVPINI